MIGKKTEKKLPEAGGNYVDVRDCEHDASLN